MQHILFASDLTASSRLAFEMALCLALTFGARVSLLYDYTLLSSAHLDPDLLEAGSVEAMEALLRQRGGQQLQTLADQLNAAGVHTRLYLVRGHTGEQIVSKASKQDCDLILIGSRCLDSYEACLLGSTSTYVLHHSPCPVMVVPGKANLR